jgi:hypothetical protein
VLTYVERVNTLPISQQLLPDLRERLMHGVHGQNATPGQFRQHQNWIDQF